MTTGEQTNEDLFREEALATIKAAQGLGYLSATRVAGDLEDILNHVAENAFAAPASPEVSALQEQLYKVRTLTEQVRIPFFGIEVMTDENDGSISLVFAD